MLPAYRALERVDNVNFSRRTLWQGDVDDGEVFDPLSGGARGLQYVEEATDLADFPDEKYDAVLASHVLEHIANPFRALGEWRRVLRPDGFLVLVVPDGARTFDHRRPVTTMAHLEADLREGKEEDDLAHLAEVIALDDRRWSDGPDSLDEMRLLWQRNFQTRTLHHHVFDSHLVSAVVSRAGFEVGEVEHVWPYHIVVIARRPPTIVSMGANEQTPVADDHLTGPNAGVAPLKATAIVAAGSVITLALSVATLKAFALFVGPDGVGFLALLQSILNLGVLVGTFGLSTALVTAIAGAASTGDSKRVAALRRAGHALGFMGAGIAGGLIAAGSQLLASFMFGDATFAPAFFLVAGATACTVVAVIGTAEMTAQRRIVAVTAVGVGTAAAATLCGISLVALLGIAGIPLALLVTAVVQLSATAIFVGRAPEVSFHLPPEIIATARRLLSLGAPVAASQLAGGGVALTVPILVSQLLTTHDVGLYRAASAVTVGYLTFFLAALTQDFLPRASGAAAAELAMLIERRMRLIIGLAAPLILGLLATAPWITRILYSDSFGQAVPVLQWQLVGDLIKLPAWVLSFVLLSRQSGQRYFVAEMAAGGTLLVATVVGIAAIGLVGAGVAYAITQIVYYITVWALVRRMLPATPGRLQVVILGVAAVCALLISVALPDAIRLLAFGSAGLILAGLAWPRLYTLHSRGEL